MLFQDAHLERQRHLALLETHLLGEGAPPEFAEACRIAKEHFQAAASLVKIIDGDKVLVKASVGLDLQELPRHQAFSDFTIRSDEVFVVPDALRDPLFAASPLVTQEHPIRFYAGAPLLYHHHTRLGSLCLFDTRPREFSLGDRAELAAMADELIGVLIWRFVNEGPSPSGP